MDGWTDRSIDWLIDWENTGIFHDFFLFFRCTLSSHAEIEELLYTLAHKRLIKQLDNGTWIRWSGANDDDSNLAPEAQTTFTIGKHMPTLQVILLPQSHNFDYLR